MQVECGLTLAARQLRHQALGHPTRALRLGLTQRPAQARLDLRLAPTRCPQEIGATLVQER